jgi:tetratricopeptide (TPR) repeat protein
VTEQSSEGLTLKTHDWRALWKRCAGAVAPLALLFASGLSASAQTSGFGGDLSPLFQGILANPSDLKNTLQYAALAPSSDIESAVSTYEQLLFYNPKLSSVRFELGVLYYRLGSYEMAHEYLSTALKMADITPELRQRTQDLLAAVDKKLFPDQFTGYVQTGLRYQTNAANGPGPQTVLSSGLLFNNRFAAKSDWNWFGAFGLNYVHDFGDQHGDTFEASALGYDAQQFKLHQYDIGLLEFRAGPRFGIPTPNSIGLSIKPYFVATGGTLADAPYYGSVGGGLTVHANLGNVAIDPYAEVVQQSFRNLTLYPLASGMNGTLQTYGLQASGPIYGGLSFQSRLVYAHSDTSFNPFGYNSYAGDLWLPLNFSPLGDGRIWTLTPTAGFTQWQYAAPDPTVDPLTTPRVLEWRVGLGLEFPIWNQLMLATLVQYRADLSNVAAFAMHDLSVTAGPTLRF